MNLTIMNLIQYLKKIFKKCFIKNKYKDHEYSNIILFTPEPEYIQTFIAARTDMVELTETP